ncbi:hypothetical protein [Halostagnicola sp. A-GB9-2]|uniref:hypothetical protein n=1 Tax=Halostagnicola sp. A-GB9-2 TaxID=3048066 RepID=UPI0024BF11B4|nr:hypothetical protein [Halostagnicola sp. A-GB9-2]MDJ1430968.1 hypothetical protein [Halostagnicola sp. A-GB9-2]
MTLLERTRSVLSSGGVRGLVSSGRAFLCHHPLLVRVVARARLEYYRSVGPYDALADPFTLVSVDPNEISVANRSIDKYLATGAVRGGDWDLQTTPYEASIKHRSVEQRYIDGKAWTETDVYGELCRRIDEEGEADGCFSRDDLERRYERIDRLYESIRNRGYDPTKQYEGADSRIASSLDQVCVSIGRDGDLVFCGGGNHRLSIAKVLELEAVPIRVVVRHARWQQRRDHVARTGETELSSHPDLKDIRQR